MYFISFCKKNIDMKVKNNKNNSKCFEGNKQHIKLITE